MTIHSTTCGVGINYRHEIEKDILQNLHHLELIEMNTEKLFYRPYSDGLMHIIQSLPFVLHGLSLSMGSEMALDMHYLQQLKMVSTQFNARWLSDHLAVTRTRQLEIRNLLPVHFTKDHAKRVAKRIKSINLLINKQFLIENIAYYYPAPGSLLSEIDFLKMVLLESGGKLLLDLNNLYINAMNHRYDPYLFIDALPPDAVVEVHIAGHEKLHGLLVDTHSKPSISEVHHLLRYLLKKTRIQGVIIERDANLSHFSELLDEVYLIREIVHDASLSCH